MKINIYKKLRDRILYLEYEPGCILKEQELADGFQISRTPLRTVLLRLELEHLIKILPRTGIQVTELEVNRMTYVYQARLEIEDAIGRMATSQFSRSHIDRLAQLLEICTSLMDRKAPMELAGIDFSIKDIFNDAAGNPYLKETSDRLYALTFRLWYFNLLKLDDDEWNNEVVAVTNELTELSALLDQKAPIPVGAARKTHLLNHLERIRTKFFSLSYSVES